MFRLTLRSAVELSLVVLLGLVGLTMLLGTIDEYKAGRAFDDAMDSYSASVLEDVEDYLHAAMGAKPSYDAPQEAYGKTLIDAGRENPAKYTQALTLFEELKTRQETEHSQASLPVHVGLAVADLEAIRSRTPGQAELEQALRTARTRLEDALRLYPTCGDLHVNLATLAYLENNLARCKKGHIDKVAEVGDVSVDALPFLYNLRGLVALREASAESDPERRSRLFRGAATEFEKVREFRPDWSAPYLNLGAAHAQAILTHGTEVRVVERSVAGIKSVLSRIQKEGGPVYARVCEVLATHEIGRGRMSEALRLFKQAEDRGNLSWHARFNRAVALYLSAMDRKKGRRDRAAGLAAARTELTKALDSSMATRTDAFVAACLLATIEEDLGRPEKAMALFERAAGGSAQASDTFITKSMPRVHLCLGLLHYRAKHYGKAIEHLEKAGGSPDEVGVAKALVGRLRTLPTIDGFTASRDRLFTDHDLRISALLDAPATPGPLGPGDVRLTLTDLLRNATGPIPFQLRGPLVRAALVNLPQGRYRVDLRVSDAVGNHANAASEVFEIDREPPRILDRSPAPGATVHELTTVAFRLEDVVSQVDTSPLKASLRLPEGSALTLRLLVSRGKYLYPSADGKIRTGSAATNDVRCPVPEPTPPGTYTVSVEVPDTLGKLRSAEWQFTVAPKGGAKR